MILGLYEVSGRAVARPDHLKRNYPGRAVRLIGTHNYLAFVEIPLFYRPFGRAELDPTIEIEISLAGRHSVAPTFKLWRRLLPLNGGRWFTGYIHHHSVNTLHFINDP